MTVKKVLATQFGRLVLAGVGLVLAIGLIYVGSELNNAIALSAGLLAVVSGAVLVSMDLAIFLRSTSQIIDMVEPIYAQQRLQLEGRSQAVPNTVAYDSWVREMGFIEGEVSAAQAAPLRAEAPVSPKAAKYGNIEFRTYSASDSETDLERLERISKESGPNGLRKKLLIARVGTSLVDEASLGDYVEGHLLFKQLAFPEILPGFDLLAADEPTKFRRAMTWKEAVQRAAGEYDRTIVVVRDDELRAYQELMSRDNAVIDVQI